MKRHKLYTLLLTGLVTLGSTSCSNFLEEEDKEELPDQRRRSTKRTFRRIPN